MSDLIELEELPVEAEHSMREEIRRVSERMRGRRVATSRVMVALCGVALVVAAVPLVALLYQLFDKGLSQIDWSFFTHLPETPTIIAPNATGGVSNAIVGTIALTIYASIVAIPVGVLVGVYLAETESKLATSLRVVSQTMAGAPSILMGLFAFSFLVHDLNIGFSSIAGSFALAVLMLPVIIISTEIAVRNVPNSLREAGLALGAKSHKVSLKVVLPSSITGIVTGCILAISRAVGETAPVLLVIGGGFTNSWQPFDPVSAMPLAIFENAKSEYPSQRAQVWGIALVLVIFVFLLSLTARIWASRKQQVRN
ncbi:MAG: phosphate transporter, inner rane subunit PstA [Acidimicrobiaceae bacterium]|nr:phosphate transporter, inner rane subunit PstA [Acidimicrobiaceae bacterium]